MVSDPSLVDARVADFIYREARLADEARYADWEVLWDDDALYWVPTHEGTDPAREISYIYDNRPRIAKRVAQLKTGNRHAQSPPSKMRRLLSNLEVTERDGVSVTVGSNFVLYEYRYAMTLWAGRYVHRVRVDRDGAPLRLMGKTVHLVNGDAAISTLAFLI